MGATAGSTEDGGFESIFKCNIPINGLPNHTTWRINKDRNSTLREIIIEPTEISVPEAEWERLVQQILSATLAAALAEKKVTFAQRDSFYYVGPRLDGEYWLPGFRFAPGDPDGDDRYLIHAERVVNLDFKVEAVSGHYASVLGREIARRHIARLSLLLNIGFYRPRIASVWVCPDQQDVSDSAYKSERRFLGYYDDSPLMSHFPKKGELCNLGEYSGFLLSRYSFDGTYKIPKEVRSILRGIDKADAEDREAFDRAARLYQVALVAGEQFPSVGIAYRVAAVEAIAQTIRPALSFGAFVRKYVKGDDLPALLDFLYSTARSAHFHAGKFPLGEFAAERWFDPLMDEAMVRRNELSLRSTALLRSAILSWLSSTTGVPLGRPER